jgi:two-component system chemotaxis response regulator CheY
MRAFDLPDLSVLVVEPSVAQRVAMRASLEQHGVREIGEAGSGGAALEALGENAFRLVISSMYLPDMTATDLVLRLRESAQHAETPFMLVSSEERFEQLDPIRQAGVIAILPKPFTAADMRRALLNTLQFLNPDRLELEYYDPEMLRVLVVDDSSYARMHISKVLASLGIERLSYAKDGREAAAMLYRQEFDLIVTDYNMPEMDGLELIRCVRDEIGDGDTPILMVTSESNESRLTAIRQSGVSAVCDKPFEATTVKQLIFQVLQE